MTKEQSRARDLETLALSLAGRGWTVRLAPPGEDGAPALPHVAALTRVPRRAAYAVCVDDVGLAVWDAADTPARGRWSSPDASTSSVGRVPG